MPRPPRKPGSPDDPRRPEHGPGRGARRGRGPRRSPPRGHRPPLRPSEPLAGSWDHVADWYDRLVGDEGSDYHQHVILPSVIRLLAPQAGERFLDLCCGQGVLARQLIEHRPELVLGIDASPRLIAAARARSLGESRIRFEVCDARRLGELADGTFDAATVVMALQDLDGLDDVCRELARALRSGGRAVFIIMHPCFRIPRQSEWGWDESKKTQFRRIDRYMTPLTIPIATHPGREPGQQTLYHHRPLADYLNALGRAGLAVVATEEPCTHRRAQPGGRSRGENRAADEFPVFLALKAVRVTLPTAAPPR